MTVGVVGLGLIGGSFAKAYAEKGHAVLAFDRDEAVLGYAMLSGVVAGALDTESLKRCDLILIALNPGDAISYLSGIAPDIASSAMVIDCCGVKRLVCDACFKLAREHGFTFVGGHPMAGNHKSGFKNSRASLLSGASMIIVPPVYDDPALFGRIEEVLKPVGFGHLTVTTAEKHDQMIAFSSQMAHIVSNAYIKSKTAAEHKGYSAGSYNDLTRVARLNPPMWTELCMANDSNLLYELDGFIEELTKYRDALAEKDYDALERLFAEGSRLKEEID